jgi:hypothetical protein
MQFLDPALVSFTPSGLAPAVIVTQGLRPGLHSYAASRLGRREPMPVELIASRRLTGS